MSSCLKVWFLATALAFGFGNLVLAAADAPAKPAGRTITLSDFGAEDLAYLAIPATPPTLAVVLVPDAYGLDDFTKAEADRLASLGYLALAIDVYNGKLTTDPGDLANLVANMNSATVMKTIDAGIRFFHESPKFQVDHVVVMGWGTGATYTFQAARENKMLDGAITFYGPVVTADHVIGKFPAALCALYPTGDLTATHDVVLSFQQRMKDAGNDCECWFIAAGSGWANPKSKTYSPIEDKEAWKVALPFLVRIGAQPAKPKNDSIIDKAKDKLDTFLSRAQVKPDEFRKTVIDNFGYLVRDFGFHVDTTRTKTDRFLLVEFVSDKTRIIIEYPCWGPDIGVYLTAVDPSKVKYASYPLSDLLELRGSSSQIPEHPEERFSSNIMLGQICTYAKALRVYASDILKGDHAVYPILASRTAERLKEGDRKRQPNKSS